MPSTNKDFIIIIIVVVVTIIIPLSQEQIFSHNRCPLHAQKLAVLVQSRSNANSADSEVSDADLDSMLKVIVPMHLEVAARCVPFSKKM